MIVTKGATDITTYVMMVDSAAGTPETALTITNIDLQYTRSQASPAAKVDATALAATNSAHGDNKAIEIDATSSPGLYRVDWPDAAFATGADKVILVVTCAGCAPAVIHVDLVNYNTQDGVRMGLTALPNAAADGAGGLPISDAGGLDLDARLDVAVSSRLAPTIVGRTLDVTATGEAGLDFDNVSSTSLITLHSLTITNRLSVTDGILVTASTANRAAVDLTGNGTGQGFKSVGGASSNGMLIQSGASAVGAAFYIGNQGSGPGLSVNGGPSGGSAAEFVAGAGIGIYVNGAAGDGVDIRGSAIGLHVQSSSAGAGMVITGAGLAHGVEITAGNGAPGPNHGIVITGRQNGDGLRAVAHGTGIDINGDLDAAMIRSTVGLAAANLDTQLAAISGFIDTEISTLITLIGTPSGASLSADVLAIFNAIAIVTGTADSGSTTTMVDAARTEGDADYWKGMRIVFTSGTIAGQARIITDFNAGTDTFTFAPPTTQAVGTNNYRIESNVSVWDDTIAEHLIAGSTGEALNAAGAAGDPWTTALPGAYAAGTAGFILGTNLNATVSSRASQVSVDDLPTNAELATALAAADDAVLAAIAALNNIAAADVWASATRRLSAGGIDDILDEVVEGTTTLRQMLRGFAAAMLGKSSGLATSSAVYRDIGDTKDRVTATVDTDGNRSAVTLDLT